jgi:hypothetical protein
LDLPQPFGPTTPVNPASMRKSVGSQKLLKPAKRSRSNFMGLALFHPFPSAGAERGGARLDGLGRVRLDAPAAGGGATPPQRRRAIKARS